MRKSFPLFAKIFPFLDGVLIQLGKLILLDEDCFDYGVGSAPLHLRFDTRNLAIYSNVFTKQPILVGQRLAKIPQHCFPMILVAAPTLISQYTFSFNNFSIIYLFNDGGPGSVVGNAGSLNILISWIIN